MSPPRSRRAIAYDERGCIEENDAVSPRAADLGHPAADARHPGHVSADW